MNHPLTVARTSGHFWLGLLHDSVEDGYLPKFLCRLWPALDAITRRKDEDYFGYIHRCKLNWKARAVKLANLEHNMTRNGGAGGDLMQRYRKAEDILLGITPGLREGLKRFNEIFGENRNV